MELRLNVGVPDEINWYVGRSALVCGLKDSYCSDTHGFLRTYNLKRPKHIREASVEQIAHDLYL